ncbi:hypothetical protein [Planctomicrobium piriforme]|uniref:Biotin-requiring enzyme n=1 Tax=Planctomicrobium piriforme TaxID=1576369 RepID=A0A1I3T6Q1_9PLAN|nr:hypothetical protein [Planctomicrobium piriforme]SFJ65197.1 hypothetical protein SAMN05421753_12721 [Planctomicrobium piriforme]
MNQDTFRDGFAAVAAPDLGGEGQPIRFITWLVPAPARVIPGERIAELLVQGTLFQLDADAEGVLEEQLVQPGQTVVPGETLGWLRLAKDE